MVWEGKGGGGGLLKDLLELQINSHSISKLPTGFKKKEACTVFGVELTMGPTVPLAAKIR